jgi:hypothetical protein
MTVWPAWIVSVHSPEAVTHSLIPEFCDDGKASVELNGGGVCLVWFAP